MNFAQEFWWRQAKSDHDIFERFRHDGEAECHLLHYLQMATEKLSKAYFCRSGHAPPKCHAGFVRFQKALLGGPTVELSRIAEALGFGRSEDLKS